MEITSEQLADQRHIVVVDIRTPDERRLCGSIPGSVALPQERILSEPWRLLEVQGDAPVALVCMSGRRSGELCRRLAETQPAFTLVGGVLGWGADGLPLTGRVPVDFTPPADLDEMERELMSCFVAESVETLLSRDEDLFMVTNPRQEVRDRIEEKRADGVPHREALAQTIGELARLAWHNGHPLDKIAVNIDRMHAMLAAVPSSS